jgi:hypothetical protein
MTLLDKIIFFFVHVQLQSSSMSHCLTVKAGSATKRRVLQYCGAPTFLAFSYSRPRAGVGRDVAEQWLLADSQAADL